MKKETPYQEGVQDHCQILKMPIAHILFILEINSSNLWV